MLRPNRVEDILIYCVAGFSPFTGVVATFASGPAEYLNKESFAKSRLMNPGIKGTKGIRNVRIIYKYHKGIKVS